ncbi:NAD(P)H-quinone oxidoreductase [Rhodococcus sp. MSC1_016]|jgi:putative PIG3 family NAD(P)H quinone oxidoreductase|uniref:NAD(P)H-quinone oxidoreductase n=1 Tax=Rhodococcus sp. MSC1_016 TaxID=2909266 RepID=UPI00202DE805|nr:NAD(P)H-quinone oxidoreductase [Rhodococcus sp. MSC1_016]
MQAITLTGFGDPDVMVWTDHPDPAPAAGEVVIDVAAAGVNRADINQRQGHYPPPAGASEILGLEVSGVISEVGPAVSGWEIGDRICALLSGGGYAERVAVPASQVLPIPDGVDLHTAAALPEAACTVWSNLATTAHLRRGETVLIHGGGSGIGTHAIQVVKALGARSAVTAGSSKKLDACRGLGADILINYTDADFVTAVKENTDGHGVDVVLDNMGAAYLARNVTALAHGGRLVVIGLQGGWDGTLNLAKLMAKRASVHSTSLRSRPTAGRGGKADIVDDVVKHVWPMISAGAVRPVVHAALPIEDVSTAHRMLDDPDTIGKVLLSLT